MNKALGALVVGLILVPSVAFAQTAKVDNTAQIQATLASLIAQVKDLQARLAVLEEKKGSVVPVISVASSTPVQVEHEWYCVRYVHNVATKCGGDN